jgi:glycosyltransferase involved in cell wall biosynthesis
MERRGMKIALIVSSRVPFPSNAGFKKRILKLAQFLREDGYRVTLFCIANFVGDLERLRQENSVFNRIIAAPFSRPMAAVQVVGALLKNQAMQTRLYFNPRAQRLLRNVLAEVNPDLVIWNHVRVVEYARNSPRIGRWILDYHDSLSLYYTTIGGYARWPWKMIYRYEGKRLVEYERQALSLFDEAFVTAPRDRRAIEPKGDKLIVLPMGVESELLRIDRREVENTVCFIGKLDYLPNENAVLYFLSDVLSRFPEPSLRFHIIGSNATPKILKAVTNEKRAVLHGFLADPYPLLAASKLIVAPVRMGGGVQNKILEGMALGKCVLTFASRLDGLPDIVNGIHLVAARDEPEYLRDFERLIGDPALCREIGASARAYIAERWTWPTIKGTFLASLSGPTQGG